MRTTISFTFDHTDECDTQAIAGAMWAQVADADGVTGNIRETISTPLDAARAAFWATLAAAYPGTTTGDLDPRLSVSFEQATYVAASAWVEDNSPI